MKTVLVLVIRFYQNCISPILGPRCRFYPTCSQYAIEALEKKGVIIGSERTIKRICKCHQWHAGGYDPVE